MVLHLAPLLSPVLSRRIEDNEITKNMAGETRTTHMIKVMCRVVAAKMKQARAALVFEDVHWMDQSSWVLLHAVTKQVHPLLVLLTTRPVPEKEAPSELAAIQSEADTLELAGLGKTDIEELMCVTHTVQSVPSNLTTVIAEKSGGNPFWAKEFMHSMKEQGVLDIKDNKLDLLVEDMSKIEFPSSVETLITSRIDRLPLGMQLLLKVASVIAAKDSFGHVSLGNLLTAGDIELPTGSTIKGCLDALCDVDMLQLDKEASTPGLSKYEFKHVSVKDVSYSLLPMELKTKLHHSGACVRGPFTSSEQLF
jgi:predicted ATPase